MLIKLNGFMALNGEELFFDNLKIEIDDDIEVPFDDIDEDFTEECDPECNENCYSCEYSDDEDDELDCENNYSEECEDCGFCDIDDKYYVEDYNDLLNKYVDRLKYAYCKCDECVKNILDEFIEEFTE